jgi:selenium metabolism protein YedF
MSKIVDCRGLSCPQPAIQTKQAPAQTKHITVVVDTTMSRDNLDRVAQSQGCNVQVTEGGDEFSIHIVKDSAPSGAPTPVTETDTRTEPIVLVIPQDQMGRGAPELGNILMRSLLHALGDVSPRPQVTIFFNTGVKLTVNGSEALEDLRALEQQGVQILLCGTCLDYFDLKNEIAVGTISNMYTIAETMRAAGRLITI